MNNTRTLTVTMDELSEMRDALMHCIGATMPHGIDDDDPLATALVAVDAAMAQSE